MGGGSSRIGGFSSPFGKTGIHIGGWHHKGGGSSNSAEVARQADQEAAAQLAAQQAAAEAARQAAAQRAAQQAAIEAARREAAAQAAAEAVAQDAARLIAAATVAQCVAETAAQYRDHVFTQQLEIQTMAREVDQLLEQLVVQESEAHRAVTAATEYVTETADKEHALHEKIQKEKAQRRINYPPPRHPEYIHTGIPGYTDSPELAAHVATTQAKMKLAAEIVAQQAAEEGTQLAKQRLTLIAEAKQAATNAAQQAIQEADRLALKSIEAKQLAEVATTRVSPVATRITPAYQAHIQSTAKQVAQQTQVEALAQLANEPTRNALKSILQEVSELGAGLTTAQKGSQDASQEVTRLIAQKNEAEQAGEEAAQRMTKVHEQRAAQDIAEGHKPHYASYPWYVSESIAIARALDYISTTNRLIEEDHIRKAQQANDPKVAEYAAQIIPQLVEMRQQECEAQLAMAQATQKTSEGAKLVATYRAAMMRYKGTLVGAYQHVMQLEAEYASQQANQEITHLTNKIAEMEAIAAKAVTVDIQQAFAQRSSELSVSLVAAREKGIQATEEVARLAAQEVEAQRFADEVVEKFKQNPIVLRKAEAHPTEFAGILTLYRLEHYAKALESQINNHNTAREATVQQHLVEEKRQHDASQAMKATPSGQTQSAVKVSTTSFFSKMPPRTSTSDVQKANAGTQNTLLDAHETEIAQPTFSGHS